MKFTSRWATSLAGGSTLAAVLGGLATSAVVFAIVLFFDRLERDEHDSATRFLALELLTAARARLEQTVNERLLIDRAIATFVRSNRDNLATSFPQFADPLLRDREGILGVALAPDSIVRYVHPKKGFEAAIDELTAHPSLTQALLQTEELDQIDVSGLVELRQGGSALIGRIPIFFSSRGRAEPTYWGAAVIFLDFDALIHAAGLSDGTGSFVFALRSGGEGATGKALFGDPAAFGSGRVVTDVLIPGGRWQLAASPREGARLPGQEAPLDLRVGGGLLAVLAGLAVWWLVRDPVRLRRRVAVATAELAATSSSLLATQENMAQGILVFDRDGRLTHANGRFMELLDLPDRLSVPGCSLVEILTFRAERGDFGPGDPEQLVRQRSAVVGRGEPVVVEETRPSGAATLIEGKPMPGGGLVVTCTEIKRADAALRRARDELENRVAERTDELATAYQKMVEEVRERRRAEGEMREAKESAELANRSKTEFLANMSHELRTPLNAVIGFSDLILKQANGPVGTPKYIEYAEGIHQSGQHLLDIINDLLDLSKIEAGRQTLSESIVDIADTVQVCRRLVQTRADDGNVRVGVKRAMNPLRLRADRRLLKQILLNIMSNAVKFTGPGGRVTVETELAPDGQATIRVSDTGIGIKAQDLRRLMQPFQQVDGSSARRHEGTGLGLSLAKAMTELHDGTLDLQSEFGAGTVVTLAFPKERVRQAD